MHQKNIEVAKLHAKKSNLKINYQDKSPEQLDSTEKFDIILNLEIIEHVENVDSPKILQQLNKKRWLNVYGYFK